MFFENLLFKIWPIPLLIHFGQFVGHALVLKKFGFGLYLDFYTNFIQSRPGQAYILDSRFYSFNDFTYFPNALKK
jgi:hypothetical protein